ncbi:MAG: phosphonate metabolism protein/1,5-bisphosphokinase (PRPP-forming) PhnN [Candidatus Competibacteraceae bacterium]
MNAGRGLFYLIGASGSGKDSVMRHARQVLAGQGNTIFAHRYITRPQDPIGEAHIPLSEGEFAQRLHAGCFVMQWDSHGYRYGVGLEIEQWLALGLQVVVNGSRAYLAQVRQRYPHLQAVLIRVSPQRLHERLVERGRESAAAIADRLQRAEDFDIQTQGDSGVHIIDNNGALEEAGSRLLELLRG